MKKGKLIVFEGIDGAGTSTQVYRLAEHIESLDKYQDVLKTHEPWRSEEIKRKLREDKEIYSGVEVATELFVTDRAEHTRKLIRPNINEGVIVLCDRYSASTCAYQWVQGIEIEDLMAIHKDRGILTPDLTILLDVPVEVAIERNKVKKREKFEDPEFQKKVAHAYDAIYSMSKVKPGFFGEIIKIDGNRTVEEVASMISREFDKFYSNWV